VFFDKRSYDFYEALFIFAAEYAATFAFLMIKPRDVFVFFKEVEQVQVVYGTDVRVGA
jgi:hypothetical protein